MSISRRLKACGILKSKKRGDGGNAAHFFTPVHQENGSRVDLVIPNHAFAPAKKH